MVFLQCGTVSSGTNKIFDEIKAKELETLIKNKTGKVVEISQKKSSESPPLAYDLTELQRDANRKYHLSAKQTLSVMQSLYERHKLVTYPRTDSRYITSDMIDSLSSRLQCLSLAGYKKLVDPILSETNFTIKKICE